MSSADRQRLQGHLDEARQLLSGWDHHNWGNTVSPKRVKLGAMASKKRRNVLIAVGALVVVLAGLYTVGRTVNSGDLGFSTCVHVFGLGAVNGCNSIFPTPPATAAQTRWINCSVKVGEKYADSSYSVKLLNQVTTKQCGKYPDS
jgi:hypothetical protein